MNEPIAASISACFKCWQVWSGEYTRDDKTVHWGSFWEPLRCDFPADAKPHCCLGHRIVFYDASGNKRLGELDHYDFMAAHPNLLFLEGKWREVVSGRVEYFEGQWYMRWAVSTNTRWARKLNEVTDQHD